MQYSPGLTESEHRYLRGLFAYLDNELPPDGRVVWSRVAKLAGLSRRTVFSIRQRPRVLAAVQQHAAKRLDTGAVYAVEAFATALARILQGLQSGELPVRAMTREHVRLIERGLIIAGLDHCRLDEQPPAPAANDSANDLNDAGKEWLKSLLTQLDRRSSCSMPPAERQ